MPPDAPLTRDRILAAAEEVIRRFGPAKATVVDLARALGLTPPAMSRHLRTLRQTGLVEETHAEFDARLRIYSLRPGPMDELKRWLEETEAMWVDQLGAFKAHLEKGAA